jgi:hypothetical protein
VRGIGKSERNKGHKWERAVANSLHIVDPTAKRNLEYQEGGTRDIMTRLPFKIQCKNSKRPKFLDAVREANTNKDKDEMGLGAVKVTNKGEYAIMEWEDFLRLLRLCFIHV